MEYYSNPVPTGGSNPSTTPPHPTERQPTGPSGTPAEVPTEKPVPSSADGGGTQPAPSLADQIATLWHGTGTAGFNLKAGLILVGLTVLLISGIAWLLSN